MGRCCSLAIDNGVETSALLMLATGGRGAAPPHGGPIVADGIMEETKYNLSRFLLKIADTLESHGWRTVGDLLESGYVLPDFPTERAITILEILRGSDRAALRFLANIIEHPEIMMDDESRFLN